MVEKLVRPVKLTVIKGHDCDKLLFSITNYHSMLPNILLLELLQVLKEIVNEYGDEAYIPVLSLVEGKHNRMELRLKVFYRRLEFDERLDEVFWGFYDILVHRMSDDYGVSIYRKGG